MSRDLPEHYQRLEAFLGARRGEIYAEPNSDLHAEIARQAFAKLQATFPLLPGGQALDVGCGQGAALEMFAAAGLEAVGITLGPDVAACRARGLDVREMDFSFLDFEDGAFDLVWCRHALEHSIFPFFTLAEMRRVLRPGGRLYVEVPAPDTACAHQSNPNHYSVMGRSMWTELMQRAGFVSIQGRDWALTTAAGPDLYWGFWMIRPG